MAPSATRRAAELKFSPCGEQFGCIEAAGSLCLWRFQSGTDVPLPFSRLQCHGKRGADLCFVGTSVVVATVGQSVGLTAPSLCLWDMLLPPSQALITSCAAHSEGGCCVLHSPSDMSLISGRSMVTSASALACSGPYPCGHLPLQRPIHLLRAAPLGPRGAPSPLSCMRDSSRTLVPARSRRLHLRVTTGAPPPPPRWWAEGRDGHLRLAAAAAAGAVERALARDALARTRCHHGALLLRLLGRGHQAVGPRACNPCPCPYPCPCSMSMFHVPCSRVATLRDNPALATLCTRGRNPVCPGGISRNLVPPTRRARAAPPTSLRPLSRRRSCWALGPGRTSRTRCCTPSPGCKSAAPTGWRSSSRMAPTDSSAPAPTARAACGTLLEEGSK
jgi:hypothetical protein